MVKKRICMSCDSEVPENATSCPTCGVDLELFGMEVEDKKKELENLLSSVIGESELEEKTSRASEPGTSDRGETPEPAPEPSSVFDLSELEALEAPGVTPKKNRPS
ncbi:MAG: hypothetical protein ACP5JR_01245 [Thermoplasmata archaeon]